MEYGIEAYAEFFLKAFASAGYHAILFDYRGWGKSQGTRYEIEFKGQRDDVCSVARWAEQQLDMDSKRIILWGTSLGSNHCLRLAADDQASYAAVVCNNPFTSGYCVLARALTPWAMAYAFVGLLDGAYSLIGTKPILCRWTQHCGPKTGKCKKFSRGILVTGKAAQGFWNISKGSYFPDGNHGQGRNIIQLLHSETWLKASKIDIPILFTPISKDGLCPKWTATQAAKRAPKGEYNLVGGPRSDHFSVYESDAEGNCLKETVEVHLEFLKRTVPP